MEANACFCYDEGLLSPCVESVLQHSSAGSTQIRPGSTLLEAAEVVKEQAGVSPDCQVSFLDRDRWVRIRNQVAGYLVQPGMQYLFRIVPGQAFTPRKDGTLLHKNMDTGSREEFKRFMAKNSTQALCKDMMFFLKAVSSSSKMDTRENMHREFEARFGVGLFSQDTVGKTGVLLLGKESCSIRVAMAGYVRQSESLALNDEDQNSLEELGFLFWMGHLQRIKPSMKVGQRITVVDSCAKKHLTVQVLSDLTTSLTSNAVLKVCCDRRELVMKIGHSAYAKQLSEMLCVQLRDQAEREARILMNLQGNDLVPRLVLSGYWDDKFVLLTELEGLPLLNQQQLPGDAATVEQMCRDLSRTVLLLFHTYGIAHADINLTNIGVYCRPDKHASRRFYLYDFGLAVEVEEPHQTPVSLLFSSLWAIKNSGKSISLMSELTAVAYVCLYLAGGCSLPWLAAAERKDLVTCCEWRELYTMSLDENTVLQSLDPRVRDWITFVLTQPDNAAFDPVWSAACGLLDISTANASAHRAWFEQEEGPVVCTPGRGYSCSWGQGLEHFRRGLQQS